VPAICESAATDMTELGGAESMLVLNTMVMRTSVADTLGNATRDPHSLDMLGPIMVELRGP
jgi:hypothetical protein